MWSVYTMEYYIIKKNEILPFAVTWMDLQGAAAAAVAKSLQLCLTLCDPIDGSPPGFPIPEILQAGTLEWVAIAFSAGMLQSMELQSLT